MRRRWFTLLLAVTLLSMPTAAFAGSIEQADLFYAEGQKLLAAGEFKLALDKFTQAYTTYPLAKSVFGIASSFEGLGNLPRALDAYETFTQYEQTDEANNNTQDQCTKASRGFLHSEVFLKAELEGCRNTKGGAVEGCRQNSMCLDQGLYCTNLRAIVKVA